MWILDLTLEHISFRVGTFALKSQSAPAASEEFTIPAMSRTLMLTG
jgi:hypothetical protein